MGVMLEAEIQQHRSVSLPVTDEAMTVNLAVEHLILFRPPKEYCIELSSQDSH